MTKIQTERKVIKKMGQKSDNLLKVKNKKIKRKPDVVAKRIKLDYDLNGNTPVRKGTIQTILSKEISSD